MGESFTYRLRMQNKLHLHFKPVFEYKGNCFRQVEKFVWTLSSHETIQFFFSVHMELGIARCLNFCMFKVILCEQNL